MPWRCAGSPKLIPYPLDFVPDGSYPGKFFSDCHCAGITLSYCSIFTAQLGQMFVHNFQDNGRKHNDRLIFRRVTGVSVRCRSDERPWPDALLEDFVMATLEVVQEG